MAAQLSAFDKAHTILEDRDRQSCVKSIVLGVFQYLQYVLTRSHGFPATAAVVVSQYFASSKLNVAEVTVTSPFRVLGFRVVGLRGLGPSELGWWARYSSSDLPIRLHDIVRGRAA